MAAAAVVCVAPDLGHNVVVPPPVVPTQVPTQAPPSERVCRLRIRFAKTGSMALLSHLDLMRMLERALRRSGLPISFTGGFHPLAADSDRSGPAAGGEANGEWMDLEFIRRRWPPEDAFAGPCSPCCRRASTLLRLWRCRSEAQPVAGDYVQRSGVLICIRITAGSRLWTGMGWLHHFRAQELIWHDTDKKGRPRQRDCRRRPCSAGDHDGP